MGVEEGGGTGRVPRGRDCGKALDTHKHTQTHTHAHAHVLTHARAHARAGKPKGVVHCTGGYMVYTYTTTKYVFNMAPGDVYW